MGSSPILPTTPNPYFMPYPQGYPHYQQPAIHRQAVERRIMSKFLSENRPISTIYTVWRRIRSACRPRRFWRPWGAVALLILTVSAFNGCSGWRRPAGTYPGGSPDSTRPSPILTLAVPSLPQNLDPAMSSDRDTLRVISAVFDTLVRFRSDGTGFEPGLARDWNVDRDQKIWTFELRRGVKFHDGTDLNADAVVYSLTRLLPPARTPDMPLAAVFFDPAVIGAV